MSSKTWTKTCRLFPSLPRRFLRYKQHLDSICLDYDETANLYCIWNLKKYWGGGGFTGGRFIGGFSRGQNLPGGNLTRGNLSGKNFPNAHVYELLIPSIETMYRFSLHSFLSMPVNWIWESKIMNCFLFMKQKSSLQTKTMPLDVPKIFLYFPWFGTNNRLIVIR